MNIPKELEYTEGHQWVKVKGETATIGITDFAQQQLKDIVFVELPEKKKISEGEHLVSIESVKSVSDLKSPVTGEVIEINEELLNTPDILNADCYGEGWLVKMKIEEKPGLLDAESYNKKIS